MFFELFGPDGTRFEPEMLAPAGVAYLIYIIHLACCVRLTRAFANESRGIESVMFLMDKPRYENPYYKWHVQCYHYETRTRTRTDKDGRTQTYTERVRVNTHSAHASGTIPSEDRTPEFLPNTIATQTQIDTKLDLDFSLSNYFLEYNRWRNFHRWDVHQDSSHTEDLSSRAKSCLAVWSQRNMPCWLNAGCYWLANLFAVSFLYRLLAQSRMGSQEYVYVKRCFNIARRCRGTKQRPGLKVVIEGLRGQDSILSLKEKLIKEGAIDGSAYPRIFLLPHELQDETLLGECYVQWPGFGLDSWPPKFVVMQELKGFEIVVTVPAMDSA
eukprot:symbB.v1.2.031274.t1/scaffold3615.1/size53271/1